MKKLSLNEELFDDVDIVETDVVPSVIVVDDILSTDTEKEDDPPASPDVGVDTGVANLLIDAINDEWETISKYNDLIANLQSNPEMVLTIQDIVAEENVHVGQLQKLLLQISPNVYNIQKGETEAEEQIQQSEGV